MGRTPHKDNKVETSGTKARKQPSKASFSKKASTKLRPRLPGFESPEREEQHGHDNVLSLKSFASRAKRSFTDASDSSGKWVFGGGNGGGFEGLFSPRNGGNNGRKGLFGLDSGKDDPVLKEGAAQKSIVLKR
ncbi:auxin-responsive protein IAA27-like isoform 2 [Corchorus capsularis]|uniref:Auxin-responsive protein IAA27-like isoform 2 n=1 Tax=Corchorus capsularis TaxID=210143 RepID=A0A1R3J110_COCAP|nr:auxin-responsive protein IAA27-like isoform 2 [Corchorus capsularis]